MRDWLSWKFQIFCGNAVWRYRLLRDGFKLAGLLFGDWKCYTFHALALCTCGREWRGMICITRRWQAGMEELAGDFEREEL